jgi:hypothetical protein
MLDHIILTVSDITRSLAFYEAALKPLDIRFFMPYKGEDGHPDLWGFGDGKKAFFWIKQGRRGRSARRRRGEAWRWSRRPAPPGQAARRQRKVPVTVRRSFQMGVAGGCVASRKRIASWPASGQRGSSTSTCRVISSPCRL